MPPPGREPRYLSLTQPVRFQVGQREEVLYDARGDQVHALRAELSAILVRCEMLGPGTLAGLTEGLARMLKLDARAHASVRAHLESLVQQGLLVRQDAVHDELARSGEPAPKPPPITNLGVVTAGRPASLMACLQSHAKAFATTGRRARITVADGSRDPEMASRNKAVARSVSAPGGVEVRWLGRDERWSYAERLSARSGVPLRLLQFALWPEEPFYPRNIGANRNALLLDTAGELSVQVDDDTQALFAPPPEHKDGLAITATDPVEHWYPGPGDEVFPAGAALPEDVFAIHEHLLGRTLADAIARERSIADVRPSAALLERARRPGARVRVTSSGVAGDSGFGSALSVVLARGASRARLIATERGYRHALESRTLLRAAPRSSITSDAACMATVLGLDGRDVLPPFAPVERDEDGLFAVTLQRAAPGSFTAHLPRLSPHVPPEARRADVEAELSRIAATPLNYLLSALISASGEPRFARAEDNLQAAGRALADLAQQPREAQIALRTASARTAATNLLNYERLLTEHGRAPDYWARDLERVVTALRSQITGPHLGRPVELAPSVPAEEARASVLGIARSFGELLTAWPAIYEAARDLVAEGARPSVPLEA